MEDAAMTKTQRVRLIAVLIFFSAISLPGSSYAQQQIDSGTWIGYASYSITVYNYEQMITSETSGSNLWTSFSLEFRDIPDSSIAGIGMSIGSFSIPFTIMDSELRSYGPQNASGSMDSDIYHEYYDNGNFAVSYQAILPDGFIDTTGGFAVADMNVIDVDNLTGATTNAIISFQGAGVPEPSSLVLAASGILIVSIFAWMRGFTGR
jgi:hypothetical protein